MTRTVSNMQHFLGMPAVIASPTMQAVLDMVERVARTTASVLITGESGSGKELIARAIHHYSMRSARPWVDVSCAALPEHLIESELFGYEKGAFSGADSPKPGLFELAHTGTLFLDEIGELEPKMQVKLLRVLDGTPYYRLGGTRKVTVDVRIIAATNQDLETGVRNGKFRNDLFHRLSQIHINVPPLRERRDDILPLADYFLEQQNPLLHFDRDAQQALLSRFWPGNVRELRNTIIRAAVLAEDGVVALENLPAETGFGMGALMPSQEDSGPSLDGMEKRMILDVLEQTGGHHQRAAELLGISRRTLSRKLKLYGQSEEQCLQ